MAITVDARTAAELPATRCACIYRLRIILPDTAGLENFAGDAVTSAYCTLCGRPIKQVTVTACTYDNQTEFEEDDTLKNARG